MLFVSSAISQEQKSVVINCHDCKIISLPKPQYPKAALAVGASGEVQVEILTDEQGNVVEAKAVSGHPLLFAESVKAALKAKFEPKTLSGKPVRLRAVIVYNFLPNEQTQSQKDEKNPQAKPITISLGVLNERASVLQMPIYPSAAPKMVESVTVQVKINLQTGEVVAANAVAGYQPLRFNAENAAREAKFPPVLIEFAPIFGTGVLIYKIEDFNGKTIRNPEPRPFAIVKTGIVNSRAKILAKPDFPKESKSICTIEKTEILVLIDWSGKVVAAKAVSGAEILRKAAEEAAMKAKFTPIHVNIPPVYVKATIVYNFIPEKKCKTIKSKS